MWKLSEFLSQEEDLIDKPLILLLVLASVLQTPITYSAEGRPWLANQDVVSLLAHGLPESLILRAIKGTENEFDVSFDALSNLKKAGVGEEVIDAMFSAKLTNPRSL